ncbi:MAG TPA: peptidoglycan-binding protein [Gaiellaceae bacterium]|nr:peptidoglycan-binding protein [Gaiellaceae bacterium]
MTAPARANPQQAGVQVALRGLGLYAGPIDGDFGPQTVAGIRAAQRNAGLAPSGFLNTKTRLALGPLGRPLFGARMLKLHDFGLDVSVLQYLLLRQGLYSGALDGYFDGLTVQAVRRYQRRAHLVADGVVGQRTRAALARQTGTPLKTPSPKKRVYVVRPGDSLTAIALRFGTTLPQLAAANRLRTDRVLLIGTRLVIPASTLAETPVNVRERVADWAVRLGVSTHLVRALAWMESGYQPQIVSPVGARGVLQLLPSTRSYVEDVLVGHPLPHTVNGDIEAGVLYLRHLLRQFNGNTGLALAAWYQGEAAVKQIGVYRVTKVFVADVEALELRM